jgi:predicted DNA-binding protein (MmcQ/YjbR family)
MNVEQFREYCLSLDHVIEYFPFDDVTLVFKVGGTEGKIFALLPLDAEPASANLKCNPEKAIELRESYPQIIPGFHMNKKHWNTIYIDDGLGHKLLKELIDHSYDLVYKSLTKKLRESLEKQ